MIDKKVVGLWLRQINDVLNREWDPIGGCPEDEYEAYAGKIAALIRDAASDEKLMSYLEWAEVENMGLGKPFDRERGRKVIAALRQLGQLR
jgi:hypothetical protein